MSLHHGAFRPRLVAPVLLAAVLLGLVSAPSLAGQGPAARAEFLDALGAFGLALDGSYGDEATRLSAAVTAMEGSLSKWDAAIQSYERAMAAEIGGADPQLVARMHLALGGVYLDRGRVDDALRELAAARTSDPTRPDVPLLQGLVYAQLGNAAAATEALKTADTLGGPDPVRTYLLARHLMSVGEEEGGLKLLQRFERDQRPDAAPAATDPANPPFLRLGLVHEAAGVEPFLPPVLYADGFAAVQRGDLARAMAEFRNAVARDPLSTIATSGEDQVVRAAAAFRDGLVDEARTHLETAIAQSPARAEAHRVLGMVHVASGDYDRGIAALRTAIRLNAGDERARLALGDAFVRSTQLEAAEQALRETLEVFPASGRAHHLLGLVYQELGRASDSRREFEATLKLTPLLGINTIHRRMGALSQREQDLNGAAMAYTARINAVPNDPDAHRELGEVYYLQGDNLKASAEFAVALLLDPADVEAHTAMGQLHLREGRHGEAAEASRRALELDGRHREARYVHATALIRLGNPEEGTREMQEFQRLQADDAALRSRAFELGRLRREAAVATGAGDHASAVTLLQQALVFDPTAASSHLDLGLALLKAGRLAEAVERLNTAAALNAHVDVHQHLADAYAALGQAEDRQKAQATYERLKQETIRKTGRVR